MDVQLYRYDGNDWVALNTIPAKHEHTWSEITNKPTLASFYALPYHSYRHQQPSSYPTGTGVLIKTILSYPTTFDGNGNPNGEGPPFILNLQANSYEKKFPYTLTVQGYWWANNFYNEGATLVADCDITDFHLLVVDGKLCFWFPLQEYWQGFEVRCIEAYEGRQNNLVSDVYTALKPTSQKEINLTATGKIKRVSMVGHHHTEYFDDIGSSYRGLVSKGSDGYIRTPFYGLLPYESNANGFSDLGSPTWNFNYAYIKTIYEDGTKLTDKYVKQSNEKPLLIRTRETTTNLTSVGSGNATTGNSVSVTKTLRRGDTLMIEVNSNLSYGNIPKIVTVTCGRDTSSPNSTTLHDIASFTVFDGTNLKTFSFTVSFTDNTSTLYFGSKKYVNTSLNSSTNVIDWTTGDYELFVGRVWRI